MHSRTVNAHQLATITRDHPSISHQPVGGSGRWIQLLPAHHRLRDDDRKRQCSDREHELRFVEALAQHVTCARRRDASGEEVEAVRKDE